MEAIDSIVLLIPTYRVLDYDTEQFEKVNIETGVVSNDYRIISKIKIQGIERIQRKPTEWRIDINAKVLGEDYLEGINAKKISQVFNEINKLGLVFLDGSTDNIQVQRVDIKQDLKLGSDSIDEILKDLGSFRGLLSGGRPMYELSRYNSPTNKGVQIKSPNRTKSDIKLYSKYEQMKSKNAQFLKQFDKSGAMLDYLEGVLRVEVSFWTYRLIESISNKERSLNSLLTRLNEGGIINEAFSPILKQLKTSSATHLKHNSIKGLRERSVYKEIDYMFGSDLGQAKIYIKELEGDSKALIRSYKEHLNRVSSIGFGFSNLKELFS